MTRAAGGSCGLARAGCPPREQELAPGAVSRHGHRSAYAAIVLQGCYLERGISGRWIVEPGDILTHAAFDCHDNLILRPATRVLNIPVPTSLSLPPVFRARQPDELVAAVRAGRPAGNLLRPGQVIPPLQEDWPDVLAACLRKEAIGIAQWARRKGLHAATVTRGFAAAYGVTPSRYRMEASVKRALRQIVAGAEPLAQIAADCGFADQAHLSRNIRSVSGYTPRQWRQRKSVQDGGPIPT